MLVTWAGTLSGPYPVSGWEITAYDGTSAPVLTVQKTYLTEDISVLSYIVRGLTNGTPYTFTVRGIMQNNGPVYGELSAPSAPVTPLAGAVRVDAQAVATYDPLVTNAVSTAATATPNQPVAASITVPAGADSTASSQLSLTVLSGATGTTPGGYSFFGQQVNIVSPVGSVASPLVITFVLDASILPAGTDPADVQLFRTEGSVQIALRTCAGPLTGPEDACVTRSFDATTGDLTLTVLTAHASRWNPAQLTYALTGPFQPVDAAPAINTAKAGSAIPVKFRLGGARGLDVLAAGYPKTGAATCGSAATDEIEQTVSDTKSALEYDAASGQYTYKWKTSTTLKGCRDLVLKFRDGSQLRTLYNLR